MNQIIPIASDHGGYAMKQYLIDKLKDSGYEVKDYGCHSAESVDYPDMIHPLAQDIQDGKYPLGIILCGSGNGAQMTANHHPHVRAARQHNDANILALPGRFITNEMAWDIVKAYLTTDFEGGRHLNRVKKIDI